MREALWELVYHRQGFVARIWFCNIQLVCFASRDERERATGVSLQQSRSCDGLPLQLWIPIRCRVHLRAGKTLFQVVVAKIAPSFATACVPIPLSGSIYVSRTGHGHD